MGSKDKMKFDALTQWLITFLGLPDPFENLMKAMDPLPRKMDIKTSTQNLADNLFYCIGN